MTFPVWPASSVLMLKQLTLAAAIAAAAAPALAAPAIPFVDAHVHMNNEGALIQLMNQNRIDRAVVFWGRDSNNAALAQAARARPGRLIPFVSISPERRRYRAFWQQNDLTLLQELEAALKTGIYRGIGEISVVHFPSRGFPEADFDPVGAMMTGVMSLAEQYAVPITIHCEITRLAAFEKLLAAFPRVQVIWAHGGYTPYFLARRMLERHPNLTYELSARTWTNHPRSPDYTIFRNTREIWPRWLRLIEQLPRRFVIGTDGAQRRGDGGKINRVRLLLSQLSAGTRDLVARANILRLTKAAVEP